MFILCIHIISTGETFNNVGDAIEISVAPYMQTYTVVLASGVPCHSTKKNPRFRGSGAPSLSPGGKPRGCYRVCAWTLVHANATPHNNNNNNNNNIYSCTFNNITYFPLREQLLGKILRIRLDTMANHVNSFVRNAQKSIFRL